MKKNYFSTRFQYDRKRDYVWKKITSYLKRYIPEDSVVLDLGAGYCNFVNNIEAKEKHALDIFPDMKKYANVDVISHSSYSTGMSSIKSNHFDVVFASNFFEHLSDDDMSKTISEIRRILKRGGKLIVIQPNFKYSYKTYYDDYTHKTAYTDTGMKDLLTLHNFDVEVCIPRFLPFSLKSRLSVLSFLIPVYLRLPYRPFAKQMFFVASKK